jgi:hypothetical protein
LPICAFTPTKLLLNVQKTDFSVTTCTNSEINVNVNNARRESAQDKSLTTWYVDKHGHIKT